MTTAFSRQISRALRRRFRRNPIAELRNEMEDTLSRIGSDWKGDRLPSAVPSVELSETDGSQQVRMAAGERGMMMPANGNGVLVVDDDKDTCSNLSDILTDLGYEVDVAYGGQQALDLLKQHPHRVALLDYRLPGMTGVELFQRMREVHGKLNGLLVTGYASSETTAAALAAGFRQVVNKPVDIPQLVRLIEEVAA